MTEHDKHLIQNVRTTGGPYQNENTSNSAIAIRGEMLRKLVKLFEAPVERVRTTNAIRCRKYRLRIQERIDECPMKAIEMLQLSTYADWINWF